MFNIGGWHYRKVCGRAIGYQYGNTDAFGAMNEVYVDGLSITYEMPSQHIWTYAAAVSEVPINYDAYIASNCLCSSNPGTSPPYFSLIFFLGDNWYCESGNPDPINPRPPSLLSNDSLWDGERACTINNATLPNIMIIALSCIINHIIILVCHTVLNFAFTINANQQDQFKRNVLQAIEYYDHKI
jgi:hypothetical protein